MKKTPTSRGWLAVAALATLAPCAAQAQSPAAGDLLVRARAVHLHSANRDDIAITDLSINDRWIPEVDFTWFFTPQIAAELVLTYPQKQDVRSTAHGGKIGTLKHLPPVLSVQYHFTALGSVTPYVGAGLNYTRFSSVDLPPGFSIDKNSWGAALQAGVDIALAPQWSLNVDVKKVQIRTDLYAAGASLGTFKVDPTLLSLGVGYRF